MIYPPFRCQSKNGKCLKNQPWLRFPLCLSIIFVFCLIFQQERERIQSSQDVAFCMAVAEYQDDAKVHNHKSWKFNAERMTITQRFFNQMIVMFGRFIHAKLLRQSSLDTLGFLQRITQCLKIPHESRKLFNFIESTCFETKKNCNARWRLQLHLRNISSSLYNLCY